VGFEKTFDRADGAGGVLMPELCMTGLFSKARMNVVGKLGETKLRIALNLSTLYYVAQFEFGVTPVLAVVTQSSSCELLDCAE
jgi:hypothetical protein